MQRVAVLVALMSGAIGFSLAAYAFLPKSFEPRSDRGRRIRAIAVTALMIMLVGVGIATFTGNP